MNKVYKERLLKLADFLANTVPKKHFDLDYFTHDNDQHNPDDINLCMTDKQYGVLLVKLNKIKHFVNTGRLSEKEYEVDIDFQV